MNDRTVSGEVLQAIDNDVFLLNGFTELLKAYQEKKAELIAEETDKGDYFITKYIESVAKSLKNNLAKVI